MPVEWTYHDGSRRMVKREKLGHRLKRVRIARDLSLRETATKVGVSPTYLSRVENCLYPSPPTEKTLRALAEVLGDNLDELMQLAGRVPEDVEKLINADPDMPVMLRRAREQNVTGAEFLKWLETKKRGVIPELKVPYLRESQIEHAAIAGVEWAPTCCRPPLGGLAQHEGEAMNYAEGSITSNTPECWRRLVGERITGAFAKWDAEASQTWLVTESGAAFVFNSRGAFWRASAEEVQREVDKIRQRLTVETDALRDVLRVAGVPTL
jgi:transcriptional regulator with XRE-family HTH domain